MQVSKARVLNNTSIAKGIFSLVLQAEDWIGLRVRAGCFAHIALPEGGSRLLRRPISVMDFDSRTGQLTLAIQIVGGGTNILSQCKQSDVLSVLFPLGAGFTLGDAHYVLLVGGGVGVAPLLYTRKCFAAYGAKVSAIFGFRDESLVYGQSEDDIVCTQDGSYGLHGLVTAPLEKRLQYAPPDLLCACGPVPMLKAVQELCARYRVPAQLSLEERMACGMGACLVCSCKITVGESWQHKRVCMDGPVFSAQEVNFGA